MKRTTISILTCTSLIITALLMFQCTGTKRENGGSIPFYVGSSDGGLEQSLFLVELNPGDAAFKVLDLFSGAEAPSYLAFSPGREYLYSIDDRRLEQAPDEMSVSSFRVDSETGGLSHLNSQPSGGEGPCHIWCSSKGNYLFAANYNSGDVALFPLAGNGEIQPASAVLHTEGSGPVESRQEGTHTHQVVLDPKERYLLVPDLGADRVLIFAFNKRSGTLSPNPSQPFLEMEPGAGPRHLVFHPTGKWVYVVNELNTTVTACRYDQRKGTLTRLQSLPTVPDSHQGPAYPAAVRIDREGRFLYTSTRGDESTLAVFRVETDGRINRVQVMDRVPYWPRDFNIDPSGKYLVVAGERGDLLELFTIDPDSGELGRTGTTLHLPSPGCILFLNE